MSRFGRVIAGTAVLVTASCAPLTPPGMVASNVAVAPDVAKVSPSTAPDGDVTLVVAFPPTACTATESAVFLDEEGRFLGAVAPGTAAELAVQPTSKHVFVVGSMDVVATPRTWFARHEVARRSDQGVIVAVEQADAKNCKGKWSGPLFPRPEAVSLATAVAATQGLTRLQVSAAAGGRWLDEHRERVDELVGRVRTEATTPRPVVTQTLQAN